MATCRITFTSGESVAVEGDLEVVTEELHRVATRREHSFAMLQDQAGGPIAVRPEAVVHVRAVRKEQEDAGR
jgi:hypothetical protein